jgi:glycosyltransferase involved in cell wall biosynthesis
MSNNAFSLFYPDVIDKEYLSELYKNIKDKSVIVYGAGIYGWTIRSNLCDLGNDITCFCDRDPLKQSFEYFGKTVTPPEKLSDIITENTVVIIALGPQLAADFGKIKDSLAALGVSENIIFALRYKKADRPIPVPINPQSNDTADFDKPLLPETFYKPCAILQNDKVGVFMKVYRASAVYIIRAVRSILEQSYKNLKLTIAANDCLPETLELLRKLAATDKRIDLIENPHNTWAVWEPETAAVYAKIAERFTSEGDYFCIIDNDDYYYPDFIEKTVEVIRREGADVVEAGAAVYSEDGPKTVFSYVSPQSEINFEGKKVVSDYLLRYSIFNNAMWSKLYTKKAMDLHFKYITGGDDGKGSAVTPENIWVDDYLYTVHLFVQQKKVSIIPDPMYFWTWHKSSFLTSQRIQDCFFTYAGLKPFIYDYLRGYNEKDDIWDFIIHHMGFYQGINQIEKAACEYPEETKKALNNIREYVNINFSGKPRKAANKRIDDMLRGL